MNSSGLPIPPINFSFLDDFIAGCARPNQKSDIDFLWKQGITHIVSATSEPLAKLFGIHNKGIKYLHLQILNKPSNDQIATFLKFVKDAIQLPGKILIHCQYGQERTGILLAIYLIEIKKMNPKDAIEFIHKNRPTSLKTYSSIEFVLNYQI